MKQMLLTVFFVAFAPATVSVAQGLDFDLLRGADVVFLGEVHDNPQHHDNQTQAVVVLAPKALVFEMLTPEQAGKVTDALLDDEAALEAALGWNDSGWPDFSMYYPIFAVSEGMKTYGAQVSREVLRSVITNDDLSSALDGEAGRFGLTLPLPKAQQEAREALQLEAHCNALPEEMLAGMVAAQRVRDGRLAQAALQALEETGGPVAVITGNGHARTDWGAPSLLPKEIGVVSFGQLEAEPQSEVPYDFYVTTAPVEREDPCAAFK